MEVHEESMEVQKETLHFISSRERIKSENISITHLNNNLNFKSRFYKKDH